MTEKNRIKLENMLACLKDMHASSLKFGKFSSMSSYAKSYGVSQNIGTALEQEAIIKKSGNSSNAVYVWIKSEPTEQMVSRILERLTIINRNNTEKSNGTSKPTSVISAPALVALASLSDNELFSSLKKLTTTFEKNGYEVEINVKKLVVYEYKTNR